jgi:hypothetical protein
MSAPLSFQSLVVVVTHPANAATLGNSSKCPFRSSSFWIPCSVLAPFDPSIDLGVGQLFREPPEPLSDMGRADARSAEIDRPCGVARSFQVSLNKVEPSEAVLACNLLTKDEARTALSDEVDEGRP